MNPPRSCKRSSRMKVRLRETCHERNGTDQEDRDAAFIIEMINYASCSRFLVVSEVNSYTISLEDIRYALETSTTTATIEIKSKKHPGLSCHIHFLTRLSDRREASGSNRHWVLSPDEANGKIAVSNDLSVVSPMLTNPIPDNCVDFKHKHSFVHTVHFQAFNNPCYESNLIPLLYLWGHAWKYNQILGCDTVFCVFVSGLINSTDFG